MNDTSTFLELGKTYQRAFDEMSPAKMPPDKQVIYKTWLAANPDYVPAFGTKMQSALEWVQQNPEKFNGMLQDFDLALTFLNNPTTDIDQSIFPNITDYLRTRADKAELPLISSGEESTHKKVSILRSVIDSAQKLRLGETTQPEDGEWYSYHLFVKSQEGMVAASLVDLYENYIRELGLYPTASTIDAVVSCAITEALYLTNPDGVLFQTLRNPNDEWIYGYSGFSPKFQELLYGQPIQEQV